MRIREVQEATHPDDVNASAGMYAFGDMMLVMYLAFLFLILTGLLLWLLSRYETFSRLYSRFLLGLSISSPARLGLTSPPRIELLNLLCFMRLSWSPVVLAGTGISRLPARFPQAKRLISCLPD